MRAKPKEQKGRIDSKRVENRGNRIYTCRRTSLAKNKTKWDSRKGNRGTVVRVRKEEG